MRAVLLGNGPSLDEHVERGDMDLLLDEGIPTLAVNMIDKIYPRTVWRPTHWIWVENHWRLGDRMWRTALSQHLAPQVEICHIARKYHTELKSWVDGLGEDLGYPPEPVDTEMIRWVDRCDVELGHCGQVGLEDLAHPYQGIPQEWHYPIPCRFGGSINTALTIAWSLGYHDLGVIGCDLGIKEPEPLKKDINHFGDGSYPTYLDGRLKFSNQDDTLRLVHSMARDYYLSQGGSIINVGIGGQLEVHPRRDLREWIDD